MSEGDARLGAAIRLCPNCRGQVEAGSDECPSCGQSLCPVCSAAVTEDATICPSCGTPLTLYCPACDAEVQPEDIRCPRCGTTFQSTPPAGREVSPSTDSTSTPESQPASSSPLSFPSALPESELRPVEKLACSVCGRQDHTLRVAAYPYVVSVILVTFRRAFVGMWCRRHRNLRLAFASLITATVGWLGIPFGFLFTPWALFKLARGGDQPLETNVALLSELGSQRQQAGDSQAAIRCLEAALRFRDDESIRDRLQQLYRYELPADERGDRRIAPAVAALLGAVLIGAVIGFLDYALTFLFESAFGQEKSVYALIATWMPLVALAFVGGLLLSGLIERVLVRLSCRQMLLGVTVAMMAASLAFYGLLTGEAIGDYVITLLSGPAFEAPAEVATTVGALLTRGGLLALQRLSQLEGLSGTLWTLILLACAVYFVAVSLRAAVEAVRWQRRVVMARQPVAEPGIGAISPGWAAVAGVIVALIVFASLFPQRGLVDYLEAVEHFSAGQDLANAGEMEKALGEFLEAVRLKPGWADPHTGLGWTHLENGRFDQAAEAFEQAIHLDPNSADAHAGLGWSHYQNGRFDQAAEELEEAIRLDPNLPEAHRGLGWTHLENGLFYRAAEEFEEAIRLDPNSADAHAGLGWSLYWNGQFDQAAEEFEEAIRLDPNRADAHDGLGWTYYQNDRFDRAAKEFEEAIRLDPNHADAHVGLGWTYYQNDRFDQAAEEFEEAIRLDPDSAGAHGGLGWSHYQNGRFDQAAEEFEEALRLNPNSSGAHEGLGWTYYELGDLDKAIAEFQAGLDLHPDFLNALYGLAETYAAKGDLDEAVTYYEQVTESNPDFAAGHLGLGFAYWKRAEFDQAVEQFQAVSELMPEWGAPHAILASVYDDLDQAGSMAREMRLALDLSRDPSTHYHLGLAYVRQRKYSEAEAHLQQAIDLAPGIGYYHTGLAYIYLEQEKFALALQLIDETLKIQPNDQDAYTARADIYLGQQDLDRAMDELSRAVKIAPEDGTIRDSLSLVYTLRGETARALEEAEAAIRFAPYEAGAYVRRAFAYLAQGSIRLILDDAQRAARLSPKYDLPHYLLGKHYAEVGPTARAAAEYEKFLELYRDRAWKREYRAEAEAYLANLR